MDNSDLILIDGSSFLYRAYFAAKKGLSTKSGFPTGATYILTRMLRNLAAEYANNKVLVTFDPHGDTFRNQIYPEYKANRPKMPEDLAVQVPVIHHLVVALGFPVVSLPGFEADDVIGSYATVASEKGIKVVICTGDKDMAQLVNDNICIKDSMKNVIYHRDEVINKYGVPPELMIDMLALKGDTSDNIPGMSGVGDVTAKQLLTQIGGVHTIKDNLDKIATLNFRGSKTFADRFKEQWDQIEMSYRLATIKCDVPLPIAIEEIEPPQENHDVLIALFENLEFFKFAAEQRAKKNDAVDLFTTAAPVQKMPKIIGFQLEKLEFTVPKGQVVDDVPAQAATNAAQDGASGASSTTSGANSTTAASGADTSTEATGAATAESQAAEQGETKTAKTKGRKSKAKSQEEAEPIPELLALIESAEATSNQENGAQDGDQENFLALLRSSKPRDNIEVFKNSFKLVLTQADLDELKGKLEACKLFTFSVATDETKPLAWSIVGLSIGFGPECSYYIPFHHSYEGVPAQLPMQETLESLLPFFNKSEITKVAHDLKRHRLALAFAGFNLSDDYLDKADTMVLCHLLDSSQSISLETLVERYTNYTSLAFDQSFNYEAPIVSMSLENALNKECEKALMTYRLYDVAYKELKHRYTGSSGAKLFASQMQVLDVLFHMEHKGTLIDAGVLDKLSVEFKQRLHEIEEKIYAEAGEQFTINSPRELSRIMFDKMAIPYPRQSNKVDAKGRRVYSTSEEILAELPDYPIAGLVLAYRSLTKLTSTYTEKLPKLISPLTGRVHTNFNLAGTNTGRLSSSDPNLQNIPAHGEDGKHIREAFVAPEGYLIVSADYSQIELKLLAVFSKDPSLLKAFTDKCDIHTRTAAEVLGKDEVDVTPDERSLAKRVNYGLIYGMSAQTLARQTGLKRAEAKEYIDKYFATYPVIEKYIEETKKQATRDGFVTTISGRKIFIKDIKSSGMAYRQATRAAVNAPMQGSAADIIQEAMVEIQKYINTLKPGTIFMTLQEHDELVFEVRLGALKEFIQKLKEIMERKINDVLIDVKVDYGTTWGEAH